MAYGLPTRGQPDWDDELNASMEALRADVQSAVANATSAQSNANDARNTAQSVKNAVIGTPDSAVAGFVNDKTTATGGALAAAYAPKWRPSTAYATGDVVMAPDGSVVQRLAAGTSGGSYTSANWQTVATVSGTQAQTELANLFPNRTSRTKHAPAFGLYFPEAEGAVGNGVADDTAACQAALTAAAGATLHLARGATFLVDTLNAPSSTRITGGGTLKFKANTTAFALVAVTDKTNVVIDGITFDGNNAGQTTWSEFRHSLQVVGSSSNITVRGCTFLNPIGDGIYVVSSSGNIPANVDIDGNSFIGTNANRNGVSLIACTDGRIRGNYFYKMSRDDMPGAIDLEPNAVGDTISNVAITSNVFIGGGTPNLQKAVAVNNNVGASVAGVLVANNTARDRFKYAIAVFGNNADRTKTVVKVTGNVIRSAFTASGSAAIILSSACEATVTNNDIDATTEYGIKSVGSTFKIADNRIKNSTLYGIELLGGAAEAGSITNNDIEDCGTNANVAYGGLHIKASYIDILGNRVTSSATTKTQTGIYVESGVKNRIDGNAFIGLGTRSLNCPTAPQSFGRNTYSGAFNSVSGTYPPAAETWVAGDVIFNPNPTPGSGVGWTCTTAGTPGTWKTFGAVDLSATATLDFPSVAAAGSQELSVTVTGAAVGDTVRLGAPATIEAGIVWNGYVSAANTVKVRVTNVTAAAIDPASASWKVTVVK